MIVKVGRTSGKRENYIINDNGTVRDALAKAGISVGTADEIFVNGEKVTNQDTELNNFDKVTVSSMVKGN